MGKWNEARFVCRLVSKEVSKKYIRIIRAENIKAIVADGTELHEIMTKYPHFCIAGQGVDTPQTFHGDIALMIYDNIIKKY